MMIRILILAGVALNLDYNINFTDDQWMTVLVLGAVGIGIDFLIERW